MQFFLYIIIISDLCSHHDIVLLQEHWLMPHKLYMLNQIHNDFSGTGISAIDTFLMWFVGDRTVVLQFCLGNL